MNKFKIAIGSSTLKLSQERCSFCQLNVPMSLHHLIVDCRSLGALRNKFLGDLMLKIRWNYSLDVFNLLFYTFTKQELVCFYEYFKCLTKDYALFRIQ